MKKIIIIFMFIIMITISGCASTAPVIIDEVDCVVTPTHADCIIDPIDVVDDEDEDNYIIDSTFVLPEYDSVFNQIAYDAIMVQVEELLVTLTLEEKAGQMVQAERGNISPAQVEQYGIGSVLSGGGSHPSAFNNDTDDWYDMYEAYQIGALNSSSGIPLIYGIDAVHGNNNLYGATIFPHNIGLGAANDAQLVYDISQATAEEMLVTGISWTFAPALSVVQNIRWGRTYEGYSENPEIHKNLTYQAILGFQENGVSATAKHYIADGATINGTDQGNVVLTEAELREIHLAPYVEAIKADVDTVMISYSSIEGVKMHSNDYWINDVLKGELAFKGFIISDWNAIHQLSGSFAQQVAISVNSGIDMLMEPSRWQETINTIVNNVNSGTISVGRIDDAVSRILYVKIKQGLMTNPYKHLDSNYLYNEDHQALARDAVRKSLVLLKNDNQSLPLAKSETIYFTGPGVDSVGYMSGGWTTNWQGNFNSDIGVGTSLLDAMSEVLNLNGGTIVTDINLATTVVVVLAETPYAEGQGDNGSLTLTSGNAHSGNASALQLASVAHGAGKNVVGILISGRPLILGDHLESFDSFVAAWLPGSEGGLGISDVLFGDYNFTGTLSFTWPIDISQVGYTSNKEDYDESLVMFPYRYGLEYPN